MHKRETSKVFKQLRIYHWSPVYLNKPNQKVEYLKKQVIYRQ